MGMKYSDKRSFNNGGWTHSIKSLSKFHTSWDWLMPVVEKIRTLEIVTNVNYNIDGDFIIEGLTKTEVLDIIINKEDFTSEKNMVYKAVVEFIKFYNQNKEK